MNYDILKRLGLDHLDVNSTDFLDALNKMQKRERDAVQRLDQDERAQIHGDG